jgi:hypothetical protein
VGVRANEGRKEGVKEVKVKGTWWLTAWTSGLIGYITYRANGNMYPSFLANQSIDTAKATTMND